MSDMHERGLISNSLHRHWSERTEANYCNDKQSELGVEDGLKNVDGLSAPMLVVFGEHGIKSLEDLAGCATDDLHGWSELRRGRKIRHAGILDDFRLSRKDCEAIIIGARIKAGWISEIPLHSLPDC
jgi:N utilization substance protein A